MNQKTAEPEVKNSLLAMLEYRRPEGSRTERRFITEFIQPLGAKPDKKGNYSLRIGDAPIMWSCHTDTVHRMGGMQKLVRVGDTGIGVAKNDPSNCLGADDTAGVWLMHEMIRAGVPGLYVFHRGEEIGCIGSRWLVKNTPELVKDIRFAIALDRRDKEDIITFQSGSRCCSDEFAQSLAAQLDMGYSPCPNGLFTDTAHYTDLIPECTNISVGYTGAHGSSEQLDAMFLLQLLDKLVKVDVTKLVEKRVKGTKESRYKVWQGGSYGESHNGYYNSPGYRASPYLDEFPRTGMYGFFDADGGYYSDQQEYDHNGKPVYSWARPKDGGVALKHEEAVKLRQKWWERIFTKAKKADVKKTSTNIVPYRHKQTVRTISDDLRDTSPDEDRAFVERSGIAKGWNVPLTTIVRANPEGVASYLEEYGVNSDEIIQYILDSGLDVNLK